jgi:hypothetical protein
MMKNPKTTDDALHAAASAPPLDWLQRQLSRRAGEVSFLRQHVFPHPVQPWEPAELSSAPLFAKQVVTVPVLGRKQTTCPFYVTQSFRVIGQKLFAGLQPDRSSFPEGGAMRLCLCVTPEQEIETSVVLTEPGEFQLIVEIEPELAARWAESSNDWRGSPDSIPFGLVLRPVRERTDE